MKDKNKTKEKLIKEISELKTRVAELEKEESKRKGAEEEFSDTRQLWQLTFDAIEDIVVILDKECKIVRANKAMRELFDDDLEGRFCYEVFHGADEPIDDCPCVKTFKSSNTEFSELQLEYLDNHWFDIYTFPIKDEEGKFTEVLHTVRDITEEKRAKEALRESEERYKDLFENANDLIQSVTPDGSFVYVNRAWRETIGYSEEEISGISLFDIIHPDSIEHCMEAFQRVMSGEKIESVEAVFVSKDGREVVLEGSVNCRLKDNKPVSTRGIFRDITKRKQAEEALQFQSSISQQVTDSIIVTNTDFIISYINKASEELYGYTKEELIGKTPDILNAEPMTEQIQEDIYQTLSSGKIWSGQHFNRRKDGSTFFCEFRISSLFDTEGNVSAYIGIQRDITDRKRAEEALRESEAKYRNFINNAVDIIFTIDSDGNFLEVNKSALVETGYDKGEIIGTNFINFIHPDDHSIALRAFNEAKNGEIDKSEFRITKKGGGFEWFFLSAKLVFDSEGSLKNIEGIARNITEFKKIHEQLVDSHKMMAVGTLAGGIAHDFNNILAGILGYASFLKAKSEEGDKFYKGLDTIEKASLRAAELTSQLLAYARKGKIEIKPFNLNSVVNSVYDIISKTFEKTIEISVKTDSELKNIEGDISQMNQVVMNLAINAKDAMPDGGVLTLETYNEELTTEISSEKFTIGAGDYVCLKVTDTGIGMDENTISQIFDPYFTTKDLKTSTGLGMSVVYGIVKGHGGYIDVRSEHGKGTKMMVYLSPSEGDEEIKGEETGKTIGGGTETIMIIDDETDVLFMLKNVLTDAGYSVYEHDSGREGLKDFRKRHNSIDLVILDVVMPDMDGKEVLKKMLKIDPEVRVLLASGYSEKEQHREIIELGAKGFIGKPFVVGKLLREIEEAFE